MRALEPLELALSCKMLGTKLVSTVRTPSSLNNLWFLYVCVYVDVNVGRGQLLKRGHEKRKETLRE